MENQETQPKKNWHDKYYKLLLLIPAAILLFSIIYMGIFYHQNQDFMKKDISLTGGTSITIYEKININDLKKNLSGKLNGINVKEIKDLTTGEQEAIIIETRSDSELSKKILEEYLGYKLTDKNSSFEFTGSTLSESFYKQLLIAILVAFLFMGLVVFIIFKNFIPSFAVILSAFADLFMTLVAVNILGMKVSSAGIVAFLMLIGYSVDTDILLTTRMLKRKEGSLNSRAFSAFKTGTTMTLTSFFAMLVALFVAKSFSVVLTQIFTILVIGLGFDLINTWITNVSILKWYIERKK